MQQAESQSDAMIQKKMHVDAGDPDDACQTPLGLFVALVNFQCVDKAQGSDCNAC